MAVSSVFEWDVKEPLQTTCSVAVTTLTYLPTHHAEPHLRPACFTVATNQRQVLISDMRRDRKGYSDNLRHLSRPAAAHFVASDGDCVYSS